MIRVLVVDDEPVARMAAQKILEKSGYEVLTASNGIEALDVMDNNRCHMVITDWNMPEMDGLALCRAIRDRQSRGYTYIIMVTHCGQSCETVQGFEAGVDDYVVKPYFPVDLLMRVKAAQRIIQLETRDMAIFMLAKLADSRDPETGAHLERVREYCHAITAQLRTANVFGDQIDDEFVRLIYEASPLHDIGKVAIPDRVLLKPGKLTHEEYEIMKQHALEGAITLGSALKEYPEARFLKMARNIAMSHHERYDGTGYPIGLAGNRIPLCARILAVADVYDALTSVRIYKPAYSHQHARDIIINSSGSHFDPKVVDGFLNAEVTISEIRQRYPDQDDGTLEGSPANRYLPMKMR